MSMAAATAAVEKPYFCYKCERTVTITVTPSSEPFCPDCHDSFLEEVLNPNPNPNSIPDNAFPLNDPLSLLPLLLSSSLQNPHSSLNDPDSFNPFDFLRNHLHNLHSSGARIQVVFENHPSEHGSRMPVNLGDYVIGPGLEQLIQLLAENDPNRYGAPPASKSARDSLPTIKVTKDILNSELNQCAVCKDEFGEGDEVRQMPCKHLYHDGCLMPWLEMHNSCPVCRYELPTEDPDYENRHSGSQEGQGSRGGAADNSGVERRFSISLPWPFGRQGEGSDGRGGGSTSS